MGEVAVSGPMAIMAADPDEVLANGIDGSPSDTKENVEGIINGVAGLNERVKRRAKRPSKFLSKELNRANSDSQVVAPLRALKNSRKSRNGFGRGLPKKGGAGGKGTWGALGSELAEEELDGAIDTNDPNYDETNPENKEIKMKVIHVDRSDEEIQKQISSLVAEYYDHGDTHETYLSLEELNLSMRAHLVLVTAVELAMDHKPSHREMTSVLLADLYGHMLYEPHYAKGYDMLLKNLSDLVLDTPDAPTILGNFIARSIADDCIPPKFLQGYKGKVDNEHAVMALARSESLLSMRHGLVRLDNVWGVGGGTRPVKYLVKKMVLLLQEYLSSADIAEATRCLLELEVPHFHHELVYEAIIMTIEKMDDRTSAMMCELLGSLHRAIIITPSQMKAGFLRVYEDMPQICVDVPPAYTVLERFVIRCQASKVVADDVVKKLPVRGRKRFVSEGDGGRVKDDAYF
ncbi:programmed cell death protein 4-like [Penaeus chinensis]|uniref:programmed cell death protein 4-like n=1 Tax=Penaeus chinensis TaxID=139456 RepID=UPI001FB7E6F6|nr:programmed cell death protein 4-like [Penaeus chinensis]